MTISGDFDASQIRCSEKALEECKKLDERALMLKENERQRFKDDDVTICYTNIQSAKAHIQDLLRDDQIGKCDVIGLGETWLEDDNLFNKNNQRVFEKGKYLNIVHGKGKGLAAIFKEPFDYYYTNKGLHHSFIGFRLKKHYIIFTYISSQAKPEDYKEDLIFLCHNENYRNEPLILLGDINISHDDQSHGFMILMRKLGFTQIVKKPTHDGGRIIDQVHIRNVNPQNVCLYQKPVCFSDHDLLFVSFKSTENKKHD